MFVIKKLGPPNPVKFETPCNDHSAVAEVFDKRQTSSSEKEQSPGITENWVQSVTDLTGRHKKL